MPLFGTLRTMPLPDLLQWLGTSRKTGTLQIELNKVSKSIHLEKGQIVGCSSTDPTQRLGHFLLSRGRANEEQLRQALSMQEQSGQHLGQILVDQKVLTESDLGAQLEDKAEETIFSMFDWNEAVFRFHEELQLEANVFPVSLRVEDVLLRGLKRYDEMSEIRAVFHDPGIVPGLTDREPPAEIFGNRMARTLYESIDGERTVAEILLHVHGSEYVVTRFLYELYRNGMIRIVGIKPVVMGLTPPPGPAASPAPAAAGDAGAALPPAATRDAPSPTGTPPSRPTAPPPPAATPPAAPVEAGGPLEGSGANEDLLVDWNPEIDLPPAPEPPAPVRAPDPGPPPPPPVSAPLVPAAVEPASSGTEAGAPPVFPASGAGELKALEQSDAHRLHSQLESARRLMARSEFEGALEILDRLYRRFPGDESLRRLNAEAEAAFTEKAYRHFLPPLKIPTLTKPVGLLESEQLSPSEFFLLSRIDGTWNVKSIIQIAPIREVDALRTLKRMRESGVIELREPSRQD